MDYIIPKLREFEDVYNFMDTFKDFVIVDDTKENKIFQKVNVFCEVYDGYLGVSEKINSIPSETYPLKKYICDRIKVIYTYNDEPVIPAIQKKSLPILKEVNLNFETNISQNILDACEKIFVFN